MGVGLVECKEVGQGNRASGVDAESDVGYPWCMVDCGEQ